MVPNHVISLWSSHPINLINGRQHQLATFPIHVEQKLADDESGILITLRVIASSWCVHGSDYVVFCVSCVSLSSPPLLHRCSHDAGCSFLGFCLEAGLLESGSA